MAASAARSTTDEASPAGAFLTGFVGRRTLVGADARWMGGGWLFAAEVASATLDPRTGADTSPAGFYLTGGRSLTERTLVLVRWDAFDADDGLGRQDLVVVGADWRLSSAALFRLNWLVNTRDTPDRHRWLAEAQLGF